nr:hypothetical protein GCM10017745_46630 [Saccharothrix mutabilis subsp. capreolus]
MLARAVAEHAVTAAEAELVGTTRLEGVPLADAAVAFGLSYEAAKKARQRAERRLVAYLRGDAVSREDDLVTRVADTAGRGHHRRPADLDPALADPAHPAGPPRPRRPGRREPGARLHPFVEGAFKQLFDGPSSVTAEGHLVVFSLRELPDELKAIGTLLVLDTVWRRVSNPAIRRPRLVVVDEAWLLMQDRSGAEFLFRMAKASRKHWAGLTVATQDTADVLGTDLGKAVVANAATQILLRQASQAIDEITRTFDLSAGERAFLLSADRGQGLLSAGTQRVAFQAIASPTEHYLVTSDPAELAALHDPDDHTSTSFVDLGLDPQDGDEFDDDQITLDAA